MGKKEKTLDDATITGGINWYFKTVEVVEIGGIYEYTKENSCNQHRAGAGMVLGVITLLFMLTMVKKSSLMDEVQDALKGTAAATLAAYDQNTGDYLESTNGDIWKGSYNISKSESLVDRIKENTGMDVTFFMETKGL